MGYGLAKRQIGHPIPFPGDSRLAKRFQAARTRFDETGDVMRRIALPLLGNDLTSLMPDRELVQQSQIHMHQ